MAKTPQEILGRCMSKSTHEGIVGKILGKGNCKGKCKGKKEAELEIDDKDDEE